MAGLSKRELVSLFELSVVSVELLDGIVSEVDERILYLGRVQIVQLGAQPHISLSEQVALEVLVHQDP